MRYITCLIASLLLSFCVYSQNGQYKYQWSSGNQQVTTTIQTPKGYTTTAPIVDAVDPNAKITPVGRIKYEALNSQTNKTLSEELTQALECILGADDSFAFQERFNSLLILEASYANGIVDQDLNKKIQTKLFSKTKDNGVGATWAGISFGVISNYLPTEEKRMVYNALKATVLNTEFSLATRMGAAEGLGYVRSCSVLDISKLLRSLALEMEETEMFLGNSDAGVVSFFLFKSLAHIYTVTGDYSAKDKLLQYSNMEVSVYPLTQAVWANIAAGLDGLQGFNGYLETLARWHEASSPAELGGIQAVPIDVSRIAWFLLPKYIRDVKKIAYPETLGWEIAAEWTLWGLNAVRDAMITVLCTEMMIGSMTAALYGTETAAASSYLTADVGEFIAAKYGTSLSYELSLNVTRQELNAAFAATTTGKVVNKAVSTVVSFCQRFKININKILSIKPKPYIAPELKNSLTAFQQEYKASINEPVYNYKSATNDLIENKIVNSVEGEFPLNWVDDVYSKGTTPNVVTPSGGGGAYTDVLVKPLVKTTTNLALPRISTSKTWALPSTVSSSASLTKTLTSIADVSLSPAVVAVSAKDFLIDIKNKKIIEVPELQKLIEEHKNKELVSIEIIKEDGSVLTYIVWVEKGEAGQGELEKIIANLKPLGKIKVHSSVYDDEGKTILKQENPYDLKNSTEDTDGENSIPQGTTPDDDVESTILNYDIKNNLVYQHQTRSYENVDINLVKSANEDTKKELERLGIKYSILNGRYKTNYLADGLYNENPLDETATFLVEARKVKLFVIEAKGSSGLGVGKDDLFEKALLHPKFPGTLKELNRQGVKVVIDPTIGDIVNDVAAYCKKDGTMIALNFKTTWIDFIHEIEHAELAKLIDKIYIAVEDSMFDVVFFSNSNDLVLKYKKGALLGEEIVSSMTKIENSNPDVFRRLTKIIDETSLPLCSVAVSESCAVAKQIEVLKDAGYHELNSSYFIRTEKYALEHQLYLFFKWYNNLENRQLPPLTDKQRMVYYNAIKAVAELDEKLDKFNGLSHTVMISNDGLNVVVATDANVAMLRVSDILPEASNSLSDADIKKIVSRVRKPGKDVEVAQLAMIKEVNKLTLSKDVKLKVYFIVMNQNFYYGDDPQELLRKQLKDLPSFDELITKINSSKGLRNPSYKGVFDYYNITYDVLANNLGFITSAVSERVQNPKLYKNIGGDVLLKGSIEQCLFALEEAKGIGLVEEGTYRELKKELSKSISELDAQTLLVLLNKLKAPIIEQSFLPREPYYGWLYRRFKKEEDIITLWEKRFSL